MKRKIFAVVLVIALTMSLVACGEKENMETPIGKVEPIEEPMSTQTQIEEKVSLDSTVNEEESADESVGLSFEDLSKRDYALSSGAGAWGTELSIEKDGYFHGLSFDSEMGDAGDGYPDGTRYSCQFEGQFSNITKIDEYCYEMKLEKLTYKDEVGTEKLADNVKYIASEATGLTGTDTYKVYIIGTPLSEIPENIYGPWLSYANQSETELTMIAIVNEKEELGFTSSERNAPTEEANRTMYGYQESLDYFSNQVALATTEQEKEKNATDA